VATVAAEYQELRSLDVIVFFISTDSPFTHKAWQEHELNEMVEGGVHWPMLGDQGGKIGELYGVYDEEKGIDQRSHFLLAAQHVRKTGEATPANWQPGAATLNPKPDLVGRVWKVWKPDEKESR
jgi:peroxiredoxin (alkyl hydroperoxide reductase subunit C)